MSFIDKLPPERLLLSLDKFLLRIASTPLYSTELNDSRKTYLFEKI